MRSWILSRGDDVAFFDFTIDLRILFQTMAIALVTGMVAGVGPALYETRRLHTNPLRSITGADRVRQRWRHALVVFEIVVTMALLVTATAMIDAYQRARRTDVGFSTRPLMALRVEDARGVGATHVLEVLDGLPGVASAAASTSIPMTTTGPRERMATDAAGANGVTAERVDITPEFFNVLGVSLRAGRLFSTADSPAAGTAIASEALAARLFPGGSALGAQVWIGSSPYDIVGITADYASNPLRSSGEEPRLFLPLARDSKEVTRLGFLVRAANDPAPLVQGARRSVRDAGAGTVLSANTLDQIALVIGQEILVGTTPLVPLIAIGILLTSAGIYGVLAFALTRRARELAIRVAIGASGGDLARLIAFYTLRLVMLGSVLGLGATFALVALVRSSGGAGSIFDPPLHAFLVPLGIVLAIGAIVTWLPARRAFRVDPVVLLRTQ
jgi:ABC-type antimicrobial peptide transport system permease subunit